jgi:Zn-dependent alcohol dehydrogenase
VCHSDLHFVDGSLPCAYPSILGHEASGVVEAVGAGVLDLHEGDKVILTLRPPCGRCYFCVRGQFSICSEYGASTMTGALLDGGTRLSHRGRTVSRAGVFLAAFAEQAVVPANGVVKVDDDTPLDIASVLGCAVQTGVGAVLNTAKVEAGATVLIVGLGGIGISIAQGARIAGASRVIGVDPLESRRQQSLAFGVTDAVAPDDVAGAVAEATRGIGIDYAFDAVGHSAIVDTCVNSIRPGGTAVMVGVPKIDHFVNVHALMFAMSEKKLTGCFLGSSNPHREFPRLLSLWKAGKLDLEGMVTARRPLAEIGDAFGDMKAGTGLRTVLSM